MQHINSSRQIRAHVCLLAILLVSILIRDVFAGQFSTELMLPKSTQDRNSENNGYGVKNLMEYEASGQVQKC